jgi:hypothetical protein
MELKVRSLDIIEPKSVQEIESHLLEKHEKEINQDNGLDNKEIEAAIELESVPAEIEYKEADVLSYIGKRYNKQINSLDDLVAEREQAEALPEDVAAYMKYKKKQGVGLKILLS